MRSSLVLLLLATAATSACAIDYDSNGDGVNDSCLGQYCEDPPGPVVPDPFAVETELPSGAQASGNQLAAVAVGGALELRVWARTGVTPSIRSAGAAATVVEGPAEGAWRGATVRGVADGEATLELSAGASAGQWSVQVDTLDRVELAVPGVQGRPGADDAAVLAGTTSLELRLLSASGRRLIDHSLAVDGWSDPAFTQARWDVISAPAAAGQFDLRLRADAFGVRTLPVTVVDQVDTLVLELDQPGRTAGRMCVHAEAGGQPVIGQGWSLGGAVDVTLTPTALANCVDYLYALPGARVTATFGGVTRTLELLPPAAPE
ncbi:MAG: hypothetical protein KA297_05505 [Kofleriaceae bacterium]|jgi:hypothetical protein|nr:hypothetical protein [Kofleriaceae bacterium]MBP6836399.1 hypothetical protein [Kofleriaceae bacterium]